MQGCSICEALPNLQVPAQQLPGMRWLLTECMAGAVLCYVAALLMVGAVGLAGCTTLM